jgi:hypothetical protein
MFTVHGLLAYLKTDRKRVLGMGDCTAGNMLLSPEGDCWGFRTQHITRTGVSSHNAAMFQPYSQVRFMFASYCIHFAMYEGKREVVMYAGHGMAL